MLQFSPDITLICQSNSYHLEYLLSSRDLVRLDQHLTFYHTDPFWKINNLL